MKSPCRLSPEVIINLAENGVPDDVFVDLLKESLAEIVNPLLAWDAPDAATTLWMIVQHTGGVLAARKARENAGTARVKGFSERDLDENELDDEEAGSKIEEIGSRVILNWGLALVPVPNTVMASLARGRR